MEIHIHWFEGLKPVVKKLNGPTDQTVTMLSSGKRTLTVPNFSTAQLYVFWREKLLDNNLMLSELS